MGIWSRWRKRQQACREQPVTTQDREREHEERTPPLPAELGETDRRSTGDYVYERDVLVVLAADLPAVRKHLAELQVEVVEEERVGELPVVRLRISSDRDVPAVIDALRERAGPDLRVGPNHALTFTAHVSMIPVSFPRRHDQRLALYEEPGLPGEGVRVGVLDTGAWDHPYFAGRCEFRPTDDLDGPDSDADGLLDYAAGHGTFIAGVILQHVPRATVVARRLPREAATPRQLGYVTDTRLAETLAGLPELRRVDVLSLSLGGYTHDGMGLVATDEILRDYLTGNPELVIVAGAGNDGINTPFFPAASKQVIAVGALDASASTRACFSNYGWWVDACAPGVDVHSTFLEWNGKLAPYPTSPPSACSGVLKPFDDVVYDFDAWAAWDGTSFAAPRVAAAIAAAIARGRSPREAVYDVLSAPGTRRLPGLGTVVNPRTYP